MKKTNFRKSLLASSALLAIVALIALSTATFAWYQANTAAGTSMTSVQSATSTTASLAIDTSMNLDSHNTTVAFNMSGPISPMIPSGTAEAGWTPASGSPSTFSAFSANTNFHAAPTRSDGTFTEPGSATSPATIVNAKVGPTPATGNEGDIGTTSFYLINTDMTTPMDVTTICDIETDAYRLLATEPNDWTTATYYKLDGDGQFVEKADEAWAVGTYYSKIADGGNDLRIAVFTGDTYEATISKVAATTYGPVNENKLGTASNDPESELHTYNAEGIGVINIPAKSAVEIKLVVWFEGPTTDANDAGAFVRFKFSFTGTSVNA